MKQNQLRVPVSRWLVGCTLLLIGGLLGSWLGDSLAVADVRKSPPRAAFLSGSERSEQILREMSVTLKRIDERLQRFERMAATPAAATPAP